MGCPGLSFHSPHRQRFRSAPRYRPRNGLVHTVGFIVSIGEPQEVFSDDTGRSKPQHGSEYLISAIGVWRASRMLTQGLPRSSALLIREVSEWGHAILNRNKRLELYLAGVHAVLWYHSSLCVWGLD